MTFDDYVRTLERSLETAISSAVKTLLETKHMYQHVSVDFGPTLDLAKRITGDAGRGTVKRLAGLTESPWFPLSPEPVSGRRSEPPGPIDNVRFSNSFFAAPDLTLFCNRCDKTQPYNAIGAQDVLAKSWVEPVRAVGADTYQVFVLSYLCQGCKAAPEVLMVTRKGARLTNVGRTPIEHVDLPDVIPKDVRRFFTGAVVAHQSGHTLAGLFMLRTLIEQSARKDTGITGHADEVIEKYMTKLPEDFRARFPSFRDIYSELSADIHAAIGSAELFDRSVEKIADHFDARRVFKL